MVLLLICMKGSSCKNSNKHIEFLNRLTKPPLCLLLTGRSARRVTMIVDGVRVSLNTADVELNFGSQELSSSGPIDSTTSEPNQAVEEHDKTDGMCWMYTQNLHVHYCSYPRCMKLAHHTVSILESLMLM